MLQSNTIQCSVLSCPVPSDAVHPARLNSLARVIVKTCHIAGMVAFDPGQRAIELRVLKSVLPRMRLLQETRDTPRPLDHPGHKEETTQVWGHEGAVGGWVVHMHLRAGTASLDSRLYCGRRRSCIQSTNSPATAAAAAPMLPPPLSTDHSPSSMVSFSLVVWHPAQQAASLAKERSLGV